MGIERNYQTNIPSKQIIIRDFCIDSKKICQDLQNSFLVLPELLWVTGQKDNSNKLALWL
jgi:hypothetical protein